MVVSCSGPPSELEFSLLVTPPVRLSREYKSRLTSGRLSTSFCPTVREIEDSVVSISGALPTTETDSATLPGSMVASMRALRPSSSRMPVCENVLNPVSVTSTL